MRFSGITKALPKIWKEEIFKNKDNISEDMAETTCITELLDTTETSKIYYKKFLAKIDKKEKKSETKWNLDERLGNNLIWSDIYKLPFVSSKETKLQEFQFQINRRILWTNDNLKKANVIETSRCTFCFDYTETLEHLFFECRTTHNLWLSLIDNLNLVAIYPNFQYNLKTILFGYLPPLPEHAALNNILMLTKKFIYNSRCKNVIPNYLSLLSFLKHKIEIERVGCYGRVNKFNKKWQMFRILVNRIN